MLSVQNLNFSYAKNKKIHRVFDDLNIEFSSGINVILGPNGAGKSTLLKSIFGLLKYEGNIFYENENITTMDVNEKIKLMSYLPQMDLDLSTLTVLEMVILGRLPELSHKISDDDLEIVMKTLKSLNIASLASRNFNELSGGQKKLVFIAQTLVRNPRLILLDEPVNSLDLQKQLELCQFLKKISDKQNIDIILVLHDINLASRYADHIVIIDKNGSVYDSGKPYKVVTTSMLEEVYGVISSLTYDENGIPIISPISSIRNM